LEVPKRPFERGKITAESLSLNNGRSREEERVRRLKGHRERREIL